MEKNRLGQSLSFNVGVADIVGIEAAVIYNELEFWGNNKSARSKNGWVYKSYDEMLDKFPLTEYQLRKVYKLLVLHGIIETKIMKIDGAPTFHFRFLKNFRMETEKTSETMETEKTSETLIYTDNNTDNRKSSSASVQATSSAGDGNSPEKSSAAAPRDFVDQEKVEDRQMYYNMFLAITQKLGVKPRSFSAESRGKLKQRLKSFDISELLLAAENIKKDPFMQGQNDRHKFYGTLEYILRNDGNVEKWLVKTVAPIKSAF